VIKNAKNTTEMRRILTDKGRTHRKGREDQRLPLWEVSIRDERRSSLISLKKDRTKSAEAPFATVNQQKNNWNGIGKNTFSSGSKL